MGLTSLERLESEMEDVRMQRQILEKKYEARLVALAEFDIIKLQSLRRMKHLVKAIKCDVRIFVEEPLRSINTVACTGLSMLPRALYKSIEKAGMSKEAKTKATSWVFIFATPCRPLWTCVQK